MTGILFGSLAGLVVGLALVALRERPPRPEPDLVLEDPPSRESPLPQAETAVVGLRGDPEARARTLLRRIAMGGDSQRAEAADDLGTGALPAARVVPALVLALSDPDRDVRLAALRALRRLGPAAREAVSSLLPLAAARAGDRIERAEARRALGAAGAGDAAAADRDSGAEDALALGLLDADAPCARAAAQGLLLLGARGAGRLARASAEDEDVRDLLRTLSLAPASAEEAARLLPTWERMLTARGGALRGVALRSLEAEGAGGSAAVPAVAAAARATAGRERALAADALGAIGAGSEEASLALRALLADDDARVRGAAARAISSLGDEGPPAPR